MTGQTPAYTSGLVLAIPITITPMIGAAFMHGDCNVLVQNVGANPLLTEIAFSYDALNWFVWPSQDLNGPDGNGLPSKSTVWVTLPEIRPPYVRFRSQATVATTDAQIDVYNWNAPILNGQFSSPP